MAPLSTGRVSHWSVHLRIRGASECAAAESRLLPLSGALGSEAFPVSTLVGTSVAAGLLRIVGHDPRSRGFALAAPPLCLSFHADSAGVHTAAPCFPRLCPFGIVVEQPNITTLFARDRGLWVLYIRQAVGVCAAKDPRPAAALCT